VAFWKVITDTNNVNGPEVFLWGRKKEKRPCINILTNKYSTNISL